MTNGEYMVCIRKFNENGFLEEERDMRNGWSEDKAIFIKRLEVEEFLDQEINRVQEVKDNYGVSIYACQDGRLFMAYIKAVI